MKTMNKFLTGLGIAGSLVLGLTAPADAQYSGHMTALNSTGIHLRPDALKVHANGFYHPYVYPHAGVVVRTLPAGYYSFYWNNYPYYYVNGFFYQAYADGSYKLAAPPLGAEVPSLPIDAEITTIDGSPYFQYQGIYYESVIRRDGQFAYKVVGKDGILSTGMEPDPDLPLIGDMTDRLPEGSHQVRLSGKTYWVTPGEIYLEEVQQDEKQKYRVVWVTEKKNENTGAATSTKS